MQDYLEPRPRARTATIALAIYIAVQAVQMAVSATADPDGDVASITALVTLVVMIGALVTVLAWVHRVNANAHTLANGLTVTPGWNVGWFFVPFANLWKPFDGIKETWQASENPHDWPNVPVPGLLRVWWGFWLVGNLVGNAAFRLNHADTASLSTALDLTSSAALMVAAGALIRIIAQLTRMQDHARVAQTFA